MSKLVAKKPNQRPISKRVIAGLKKTKNQKVIDLSVFKEARIYVKGLQKNVLSQEDMAKYDPLHAVYIHAQNRISTFAEQLGELPVLTELTNAYADAEDLYLPSGPPMSPLTASYFTCWGLFDLCIGIQKETFGTIAIDVCKYLKVDPRLIQLFECMQKSRMGFYVHKGTLDKYVLLEELITRKKIKAIVPSGYVGEYNQIWFARIMPEPFPELNYEYSVVFTTPYVITEMRGDEFLFSTEARWLNFFERTLELEKTGTRDKNDSYEILMKYGLDRHFWNEYIFEGYVNHTHEMIILAGFPDIPLSRPHSRESEKRMGL
jgi:hypothetical protein